MANKRFRLGFWGICILYALVILVAAGFGLRYLWQFAESYEAARPHHAIDSYLEALTPEYLLEESSQLLDGIDPHIQTREDCLEVLRQAVSGGITYAKRTSQCTEEKMVYMLRTGRQVIGTVELTPQGETRMGYTPWAVSRDSFDFSYLLTDTVSVAVPAEFPVYVNGAVLDSRYVTESGIRYSALEDFYDTYDLPTIVRYEAGPCLGSIRLTVTDPAGNPVTVDADTDLNRFLPDCTAQEQAALSGFLETFLQRYVQFSNSSPQEAWYNFNVLRPSLVEGSPLENRCRQAIAGMAYATSVRYTLRDPQIHRCIHIGSDRYLCDVTYIVDIHHKGQDLENIFHVQIIVADTADGLRAEMLRNS